jgi:hypothetical protein
MIVQLKYFGNVVLPDSKAELDDEFTSFCLFIPSQAEGKWIVMVR